MQGLMHQSCAHNAVRSCGTRSPGPAPQLPIPPSQHRATPQQEPQKQYHEHHPLQEQSSQQPSQQHAAQHGSRRWLLGTAAAATTALPLLVRPPDSAADDFAHSAAQGIISFWKGRQAQNGGIKLLAPLRVAQQRLHDAGQLLQGAAPPPDGGEDESLKAALQMVRASSLNCYSFDALPEDTLETRASLLTQRWELSDPCTFRIILKTVTDLEPQDVQQAAATKMDELVRGYQKLDAYLESAREGNPSALPKAREQLVATLQTAADIEVLVRGVLGV